MPDFGKQKPHARAVFLGKLPEHTYCAGAGETEPDGAGSDGRTWIDCAVIEPSVFWVPPTMTCIPWDRSEAAAGAGLVIEVEAEYKTICELPSRVLTVIDCGSTETI